MEYVNKLSLYIVSRFAIVDFVVNRIVQAPVVRKLDSAIHWVMMSGIFDSLGTKGDRNSEMLNFNMGFVSYWRCLESLAKITLRWIALYLPSIELSPGFCKP